MQKTGFGGLIATKTLDFPTSLAQLIQTGGIRREVAKEALDILYGKTGLKKLSKEAIDSAIGHTWEAQYRDSGRYDGDKKTPFEILIERFF